MYPQKKLASTKPTVSGVHWNSGISPILTVATPTLQRIPKLMTKPTATNQACVKRLDSPQQGHSAVQYLSTLRKPGRSRSGYSSGMAVSASLRPCEASTVLSMPPWASLKS